MNNPMDENEVVTAAAEPTATEPAFSEPTVERPSVAKSKSTAKKKTWAIVLAAVVSFLVVLAIALVILFAGNNDGTEPTTKPGGESVSVGSVSNDYFGADVEYEKSPYTKQGAYQLEGELLDTHAMLNLGCVKLFDVDNYNYNVETVQMVNLLTGATMLEKAIGNPRGETPVVGIDGEFCDECGIFSIKITYADDSETLEVDESRTEIFYYTAKANPELLGVTDSRGHECKNLGDVYAIRVDKKISFFDEEMNLLSDYNGDFLEVDDIPYLSASSYMVSEKEGYFYFFTDKEALVFNMKGDCMAKYTDEQNTYGNIITSVLNDGTLLIQRLRTLDENAEKYDVRIGTMLFAVETMIMNNVTGEITEVECNFVVEKLVAAYADNDTFPLTLKDGYDNQAFIYYFKDGALSSEMDYVVLDNSLKVQYTFPRNGASINFLDAFVIDDSRMVARVNLGSENQYYLFDINGKFISAIPADLTEFTDSFIVSKKVIYNHEMKEVYNFAANGYKFVGVTGDTVYLSCFNEATERSEIHAFNATLTEPTSVANGIDILGYLETVDDYCVVLDERGWKTVYNYNGEVIAATDGDYTLTPTEDALLMQTVINGEIRTYVLPQVKQ